MIRTLWMTLVLLTAATAQIPYGQEFQVNSYTKDWQNGPVVAALAAGGFVVCWTSWATGSEGQDGDYTGIFAQRFDADGSTAAGEFQVNSYTKNHQYQPSVAALAAGGFVVCWTSGGQDGDAGVFAQRFDADGTPSGQEFQVNSYIQSSQLGSAVAALANGGFVVCWQSDGQDGDGYGVFAQRFDADGAQDGQEFQVNSYTEDIQNTPAVAALANGGFVVCWSSDDQDGDYTGVFAQRYDADGAPVGGEFQVNSYFKYNQWASSVAALAAGGFVVCWMSYGQDGDADGVFAQRFDADGSPVGQEFQVNTYTKDGQSGRAVAALANGGFVVCWNSYGQDGDAGGVFAQRFDADGSPVGQEFQVNTYTKDWQSGPSVAALAAGDFVVCWQSEGQDGREYGIFAKRFPAQPLRHTLRPFKPLSPAYDATVTHDKPQVVWQAASEMVVAYPWELSYSVCCDTLPDFSTASFKSAGHDTTAKLPALKLGKTYFWKVLAKTYYGDSLWSDVSAFFVSHTAIVAEAKVVPGQFAVLSNYPNPFNPSTTLRFELPKDGYVTVKIYDLSGRLVKTLLSGEQTAGAHTSVWDGTDDAGCKVAAGVYFYQMEFTDASGTRQVLTQKMSLVK